MSTQRGLGWLGWDLPYDRALHGHKSWCYERIANNVEKSLDAQSRRDLYSLSTYFCAYTCLWTFNIAQTNVWKEMPSNVIVTQAHVLPAMCWIQRPLRWHLALGQMRNQSKHSLAGMSQITSLVVAPDGRWACSMSSLLPSGPSLLAGLAKSCPLASGPPGLSLGPWNVPSNFRSKCGIR